jgi:hypothetical protein
MGAFSSAPAMGASSSTTTGNAESGGRRIVDSVDLSAAELALKIVARADRYSDPGVDPILVENWIADYPDQTADQKTADLAAGRDATPAEWWSSSEN